MGRQGGVWQQYRDTRLPTAHFLPCRLAARPPPHPSLTADACPPSQHTQTDLKCYRSPRIANEPCVPGAPTNSTERCGPGLVCRPDTKRCDTPK